MNDVEGGTKTPDLGAVLAEKGAQGLEETIRNIPILLIGKTTCAFSIEAQAILEQAAGRIGGQDMVTKYWLDKMKDGASVHAALKKVLHHNTVPIVMINGEFIGGCSETKTLEAAGTLAPKIYAAAIAHKLALPSSLIAKSSEKAGSKAKRTGSTSSSVDNAAQILPDDDFIDETFKPAVADDTPPAYMPLLWFPEVVDGNVVRLTAAQTVVLLVIAIIWREHSWTHWMMLGLLLDNLARFIWGAGPSILAQVAKCLCWQLKPDFRASVPKQFAIFCGTFMSTVSVVFLFLSGFDSKEIIAACFMAVYAALAFLEAAADFCMGCYMFGLGIQFKLIPREVYTVCIATQPEAKYTYNEMTKRLKLSEPERIRMGYPRKPPSKVDVFYKTKTNDHDRQSNHPIKYVKIAHFSIVLSLTGLAALWRTAALPEIGDASGMNVSNTVGDVLGIISVVFWVVFMALYGLKAVLYPQKVAKEWFCHIRSNSFVIPSASLCIIAYVTFGRFENADTLAKVLFWIGGPLTLAIALFLVARWITDIHSNEHLNPAWLMPPMSCFVIAFIGPFLDQRYTEAMYLWFAFAFIVSVPLYVITFHKAIVFNEPDDRLRPLKWIWVAGIALAAASGQILNLFSGALESGVRGDALDGANIPVVITFGFYYRATYLAALALAMVLGLLFLTKHAPRIKFDAASSWSYAFPIEALSIATCIYAAGVQGDLPEGMSYAGLAISSSVVVLLGLHSIYSLLMEAFFTMDPKYGPLSQQILTHEAFRAAGERLKVAVTMLGTSNDASAAPALMDFALQFRKYRLAHAWHAEHEDKVIFKEFEKYVPGLCKRQNEEHEEHEVVMARWERMIQLLEKSLGLREEVDGLGTDSEDADAVKVLQSEIPAFIDDFENHLVGEEKHLQRGGRKQMNFDLQKNMIRNIWDMTPMEVWAEFLPWVVSNMPMHQQRVKFIRCFAVWAVPERAQLIGRMVSLGVDAPLWERLIQSVPEIAPRGAKGWRRYA